MSTTARIWKTLDFDPTLAPHIRWETIADTARQVGGHFTAINRADGSVRVTFFWDTEAEEAEPPATPHSADTAPAR